VSRGTEIPTHSNIRENISMTIYRKIYEQNFGPIPKDQNNRTYEIHHIDGNHSNNDPFNLRAVSINEHYDIHYAQGDWAACLRISARTKLSPETISKLASLAAKARNKNPKYINPFKARPDGSSISKDRVNSGQHQYLKRKDGSSMTSDRVIAGTHNFITNHPNKKTATCPHCNKIGGETNMMRFHFVNCWNNPNKTEIKRETFTCKHCNKTTNKGNYIRWHGSNCRARFQ